MPDPQAYCNYNEALACFILCDHIHTKFLLFEKFAAARHTYSYTYKQTYTYKCTHIKQHTHRGLRRLHSNSSSIAFSHSSSRSSCSSR